MRVESDITIDRPAAEVFDYLARAERLPDYVTDFAWVKQDSEGEPGLGTHPGGPFKVLAPMMSNGMRKGNVRALERLKHALEEAPRPA